MTTNSTLPHVDDHAVRIGASPTVVWDELLESVAGAFSGGARYARLVGGDPATAAGPRPLTVGSTIPGFRVTAAVRARELRLEGRHRFSTYTLWFRLAEADDGGTDLSAATDATFPGPAGAVYRTLVIGTKAHVVLVRRLLAGIARRAEHHSGVGGGT